MNLFHDTYIWKYTILVDRALIFPDFFWNYRINQKGLYKIHPTPLKEHELTSYDSVSLLEMSDSIFYVFWSLVLVAEITIENIADTVYYR